MYCDAPGTVQPSEGKVQTVTAISEVDGDAAGWDAADEEAGVEAGVLLAPRDVGVFLARWSAPVEPVGGPDVRARASPAPAAAATKTAAPTTSGQRLNTRRRGPVPGSGAGHGGAVGPVGWAARTVAG